MKQKMDQTQSKPEGLFLMILTATVRHMFDSLVLSRKSGFISKELYKMIILM